MLGWAEVTPTIAKAKAVAKTSKAQRALCHVSAAESAFSPKCSFPLLCMTLRSLAPSGWLRSHRLGVERG